MTVLTIGSLFTGTGGLDMALKRLLGAHTEWCSEIEPGPCKLIEHHRPDLLNLGDVRDIPWAKVPRVDILSGGFRVSGREPGRQTNRPHPVRARSEPFRVMGPYGRSDRRITADDGRRRECERATVRRQTPTTWDPDKGVWLDEHSEPFSATWPTSGMTLDGCYFPLPGSEHRTDESEYSSSPDLLAPSGRDREATPEPWVLRTA